MIPPVTPVAPALLVSVRDPREAQAAVDGGAHVIDIKEPDHGPLGRASAATVGSILKTVAGRRPVSIAMGEWSDPMQPLPDAVAYVKIGLAHAPSHWPRRLAVQFAQLRPAKPVVAAYADYHRVASPPIEAVVRWATRSRLAGVLIDTAVKDANGLFDWCSPVSLKRWITACRRAGVMIALAGSLRADTLPRALALEPDLVAVRGAACGNWDRRQRVQAARVRQLAAVVAAQRPSPGQASRPKAFSGSL